MRGGSRAGAGRPAYKRKTIACLRLDVRQLARGHYLQPGRRFSWIWWRDGEQAGSIEIQVLDADSMKLVYTYNGTPYMVRVALEQTSCNYGGSRTWGLCPRCHGRVAMLYLSDGGWVCRKCARLSYPSQSDDITARTWREQGKIERRLAGGKGEWNGWRKPKGMHQTTFDRLRHRVMDLEQVRDRLLYDFASRYFGNLR